MDWHINWQLFASVFFLIFVAELPDKTAFATALMAAHSRPGPIFLGVATAFFIQTVVAALFGNVIALAPVPWVHLGVGLMFWAFAIHTWRGLYEPLPAPESAPSANSARATFWIAVWRAFLVIFIAEWGDLTQIATVSLMAKYRENPFTVFWAALLALWSVTVIAVFVGKKASEYLNPLVLKKVSVVLFAGIGTYFIFTWL